MQGVTDWYLPDIPAAPFRLVHSSVLEGCPVLDIVSVVPHFLHWLMLAFTSDVFYLLGTLGEIITQKTARMFVLVLEYPLKA